MPDQSYRRSMQRILEVREAQAQAAEMAAAREMARCADLETERQRRGARLAEETGAWSAMMAEPSLDPYRAAGRLAAVEQAQASVHRAETDVSAAQAETTRRRTDWFEARARSALVETLLHQAARRAQKLAEAAALADTADHAARRKRRP